MTETLGDIIGQAFERARMKPKKTATEDYRPDTPFHVWFQAVMDIETHGARVHGCPLREVHVHFWWNLYRHNFSPVIAHCYNLSGDTPDVPEDKDNLFDQRPFPREPAPSLLDWLGM